MPEQPDTRYRIQAQGQIIDVLPADADSYRNGTRISVVDHTGNVWGGMIAPDALAKLAQALQAAAEMAESHKDER